MKKEIFQEIEIPKGIEVNIDGNLLKIKGESGEIEREFNFRGITVEKKENKIIIGKKVATKNDKKIINTIAAHIKNMIKGSNEKFEYKVKICSSHFPMSVEINNKEAVIKNFLGEKIPRKTKILEDVDVKIEGDIITILSNNRESAGQTAANLEKSTRISNRDRRVFQDGLFIINKAGKEI